MIQNNITAFGLFARFQMLASEYPNLIIGRILSQEKGLYRVISEKGEQFGEASGKFRYGAGSVSDFPAVGDFVMIESEKGAKYCGAKVIPEEELKIAACNALGWNEFDSDLFDETIEKVVPIGEDMIEFYPYDGGVIKQEWHSTARQRGWNEERKRTTTEKRLKTLEARKNAKEC